MSESQNKKLDPREVSLFRRVFLARVEHGANTEAAEKQALHACKIWERLGAFNDEPPPVEPESMVDEVLGVAEVIDLFERACERASWFEKHELNEETRARARTVVDYARKVLDSIELGAGLITSAELNKPETDDARVWRVRWSTLALWLIDDYQSSALAIETIGSFMTRVSNETLDFDEFMTRLKRSDIGS